MFKIKLYKKIILWVVSNFTPPVSVKKSSKTRFQLFKLLGAKNNIGIELGVARGTFSKTMIKSGYFKHYHGVDSYLGVHQGEYNQAKIVYKNKKKSTLHKLDFKDAVSIFPNNFFDFIYIDGYAHTGEQAGRLLLDWYPKLKKGGIFCGDDYSSHWPYVKWAVNNFVINNNLGEINVTAVASDLDYQKFPSWFIYKKRNSKKLILKRNFLVIMLIYIDMFRVAFKRRIINFFNN